MSIILFVYWVYSSLRVGQIKVGLCRRSTGPTSFVALIITAPVMLGRPNTLGISLPGFYEAGLGFSYKGAYNILFTMY